MEELARFLAVFLVTILGAGISYRQSTRKGARRSQAHEAKSDLLEQDNRQLSSRVADLEIIVKDQRIQIATLSHFQMLYETLKQAHDGLKLDHDELKEKFEARDAAFQASKTELESKAGTIANLERQNNDLFEANKQLAARLSAYEQVFKLQGVVIQTATIAAKSDDAQAGGETPAPVIASKETPSHE